MRALGEIVSNFLRSIRVKLPASLIDGSTPRAPSEVNSPTVGVVPTLAAPRVHGVGTELSPPGADEGIATAQVFLQIPAAHALISDFQTQCSSGQLHRLRVKVHTVQTNPSDQRARSSLLASPRRRITSAITSRITSSAS